MFIENVQFLSDEHPQTEVVCRWYIDEANHCSNAFVLGPGTSPVRAAYCSFLLLSFEDMSNRAHSITLTLSYHDGDHIAVAYLDLSGFSMEESFSTQQVELLSAEGAVAQAELHTASQMRWQTDAPVAASFIPHFVDPVTDAQSSYLHDYIVGEPAAAAAEPEVAASAAPAASAVVQEDPAEAQRRQEAEAAAARARAEEEERERQRELQRQKELEEERQRREAEQEQLRKVREEEERRRREEDEAREKKRREEREEEERQRQREREDAERERRRREEEARQVEQAQRERQLWEEERERLRQDAKRERQREVAERERRAVERRRQADVIAAKLTAGSQAAGVSKNTSRMEDGLQSQRGPMESISFADASMLPQQTVSQDHGGAHVAQRSASLHSARDPYDAYSHDATSARHQQPRQQHAAAPSSYYDPVEDVAASDPWPTATAVSAAPLWRQRAQPATGPSRRSTSSAAAGRRVSSRTAPQYCNNDDRAYSVEAVHRNHIRGMYDHQRSTTLPPARLQPTSSRAYGPGPEAGAQRGYAPLGSDGVDGVVASALADVACHGEVQVAAAEECALRLLLLQKQLSQSKDSHTAALADAASGVVPHLLQVLEAAHTVCDTSRARSAPRAIAGPCGYSPAATSCPSSVPLLQLPAHEPLLRDGFHAADLQGQYGHTYPTQASPPRMATPVRGSGMWHHDDAPGTARRPPLDPGSSGPKERIMRAASPSRNSAYAEDWGSPAMERRYAAGDAQRDISPVHPVDLYGSASGHRHHHSARRTQQRHAAPTWDAVADSIPHGTSRPSSDAMWDAVADSVGHQPAVASSQRSGVDASRRPRGGGAAMSGAPFVPPLALGSIRSSAKEDMWTALANSIAPQPGSTRRSMGSPDVRRTPLKSGGPSRRSPDKARSNARDVTDFAEDGFEDMFSPGDRGIASSATRRTHASGTGTLRSGRRSARGPTEDKYLKILQALQVKTGAGAGLAQQLLAAASKRRAST